MQFLAKAVSRNFSADYFGIRIYACDSRIKKKLDVIYDQNLFDSKVQSIVEYAQINDANINQTTCEVSGVSELEVSFVRSEHEVPMEQEVPMQEEMPIQTPIVAQSVKFEGEQLSLELEQFADFSKDYSSEKLLNGTCSTALLKPVSMVFNAEALVHTATTNSTDISVSADERIKEDCLSDVGNQHCSLDCCVVLWQTP